MAQSTSAEFLTFMRYARPSTISRSLARITQRPFLAQTSIRGYAATGDMGENKAHAVDKSKLDVQSDNAAAGREAKDSGSESSSATSGKDVGNNNERAKKETKAPGPVIGMNDERGGKGW